MDLFREMLKLQGDIVAKFIANGVTPELAQKLAQDAAHIVFSSELVDDEVRAFYADPTGGV